MNCGISESSAVILISSLNDGLRLSDNPNIVGKLMQIILYYLGGGFKPVENYWSNWIISPGIEVHIKHVSNHHLAIIPKPECSGHFEGITVFPSYTTIWGDSAVWSLQFE